MNNLPLNLFIPPPGSVRNISMIMGPEYAKRYRELGSFRRHEYDLDICTLYRQMDDLKERYTDFAGKPYEEYVKQIRGSVLIDLERLKLDADFYIDHFYQVIEPKDNSYLTYLPLFLCMNDYLRIIPVLEFHMEEFAATDCEQRGEEGFLGLLEIHVCNFIRSNRFPEDWFAKHDKILNWVYSKRSSIEADKRLKEMMGTLVDAINKSIKINIPKEVFDKVSLKRSEDKIVRVIHERIEMLFEDIKDKFGVNNHEALRRILSGHAQPNEKVIFLGQANQIIDVFRIYAIDKFITVDKRAIGKWIREHFMYYSEAIGEPRFFEEESVERIIYHKNPISPDSRIQLSGLQQARIKYYRR